MNPSRDFRIAIADDHPVIRHAIVHVLNELPGFTVDAAVNSGAALLDSLAGGTWDLIITDFTMDPGRSDADGLNLIAKLRRQHPATPIVVFTMLNNDEVLARLSRSGVAGIVDKCEGVEEFRSAALEVMRNRQPYFSERVRARLRHQPIGDGEEGSKPILTKKEREVLRLFASGASLTEIARKVNRSISTIATQKSAAMKKLLLQTNADLVKYAQDNGMT